MDYPNDRDVLETFECTRAVNFRFSSYFPPRSIYPNNNRSYRFGHISRTLRALQSSTKTSLRIDDEGLLSLQFLMPSPKPRGGGGDGGSSEAFIEFRVSFAVLILPRHGSRWISTEVWFALLVSRSGR